MVTVTFFLVTVTFFLVTVTFFPGSVNARTLPTCRPRSSNIKVTVTKNGEAAQDAQENAPRLYCHLPQIWWLSFVPFTFPSTCSHSGRSSFMNSPVLEPAQNPSEPPSSMNLT